MTAIDSSSVFPFPTERLGLFWTAVAGWVHPTLGCGCMESDPCDRCKTLAPCKRCGEPWRLGLVLVPAADMDAHIFEVHGRTVAEDANDDVEGPAPGDIEAALDAKAEDDRIEAERVR